MTLINAISLNFQNVSRINTLGSDSVAFHLSKLYSPIRCGNELRFVFFIKSMIKNHFTICDLYILVWCRYLYKCVPLSQMNTQLIYFRSSSRYNCHNSVCVSSSLISENTYNFEVIFHFILVHEKRDISLHYLNLWIPPFRRRVYFGFFLRFHGFLSRKFLFFNNTTYVIAALPFAFFLGFFSAEQLA